ncbi:MAG: hypothetical protein QME58_12880 [Bacteroidota bacterium]|nr:hypothetical protein [Bacteroidota bacterium]
MTILFVILTIIIFLAVDYIIYRKEEKAIIQYVKNILKSQQKMSALATFAGIKDIDFPKGLFLHPKHTWVQLLPSGMVKIGVDDFIVKAIGNVNRVILPPYGELLKKDKPAFSINQKDKVLNFISPVAGQVVQLNSELLKNPELFSDPYDNGWFVVVQPSKISSEIKSLKLADEAVVWLNDEMHRFREFIIRLSNGEKLTLQTLHDGGLPVRSVLSDLDEDDWSDFQKEFLL